MIKKIANKIFFIVENGLKNFWKILVRRFIISFISVLLIKSNKEYIIDFISFALDKTEAYNLIGGIVAFSFLYLAYRRWGIYNFKKDYTTQLEQQQVREKELYAKLQELGISDINLKNKDDLLSLQKITHDSDLSKDFIPTYFKLENATGSKNSFVNLNDVDYFIFKSDQLHGLKSLIEYRESLFIKELFFDIVLVGGCYYIIMWFIEDENSGGTYTVDPRIVAKFVRR